MWLREPYQLSKMSKSLGCHETFQEISKSVAFQSSDDILLEPKGRCYAVKETLDGGSDNGTQF